MKSQTGSKVVFLLSIFKVSGNKYCRQKVSGSNNFKLFTIFPTVYLRIIPQTVSKVSRIFYVSIDTIRNLTEK